MSSNERKLINDIDKELTDATHQLQRLQIQLNNTETRINELKGRRRTLNSDDKKRRNIIVGDKVRITDNYKGRRGHEGIVIKVTPTQVKIRPSNGGEVYNKYKQNVIRVQHE